MIASGNDEAIRVMIVDDHPMWTEGLARELTERGFNVCATARDGDAAVRIATATRPQVVVMDLNLGPAVTVPGSTEPLASGVLATRRVTGSLDGVRVLVLSASGEAADVLAAVKNGASGYLVKSAPLDDFVDAVRRTAAGEAVFGPGLAGLLLGEYRRLERPGGDADGDTGVPSLTERESEVLRLVARGLTARQIAERLVLSHRTVENHVQNTMRKLAVHNRAQLVRYAVRHGLSEDPSES